MAVIILKGLLILYPLSTDKSKYSLRCRQRGSYFALIEYSSQYDISLLAIRPWIEFFSFGSEILRNVGKKNISISSSSSSSWNNCKEKSTLTFGIFTTIELNFSALFIHLITSRRRLWLKFARGMGVFSISSHQPDRRQGGYSSHWSTNVCPIVFVSSHFADGRQWEWEWTTMCISFRCDGRESVWEKCRIMVICSICLKKFFCWSSRNWRWWMFCPFLPMFIHDWMVSSMIFSTFVTLIWVVSRRSNPAALICAQQLKKCCHASLPRLSLVFTIKSIKWLWNRIQSKRSSLLALILSCAPCHFDASKRTSLIIVWQVSSLIFSISREEKTLLSFLFAVADDLIFRSLCKQITHLRIDVELVEVYEEKLVSQTFALILSSVAARPVARILSRGWPISKIFHKTNSYGFPCVLSSPGFWAAVFQSQFRFISIFQYFKHENKHQSMLTGSANHLENDKK